MEKAVLEIEMPKKCGECSCRMGMVCVPTLKDIESVNQKMEWCPLKPISEKEIPKKMKIGNDNGKPRKCCGACGCFVLPASRYCSKCGYKIDREE